MGRRRKWDFFIAHAGSDTEIAETLYGLLEPRSKVFLDTKELILGDAWDEMLVKAQKQSLVTIVLVSPRTENAYYQREEIAVAVAMSRKSAQKHRVIPIFLPGYDRENVPYGLRIIHSISLKSESDLGYAAERLLDTLQRIRARRTSNKKVKVINKSESGEEALHTLRTIERILYAQLGAFDVARITPQNCDLRIQRLLEIQQLSGRFLLKNESKPVVSQLIFLYKFEEDLLSLVELMRKYRAVAMQENTEDLKQEIILGMRNLLNDVEEISLKMKG